MLKHVTTAFVLGSFCLLAISCQAQPKSEKPVAPHNSIQKKSTHNKSDVQDKNLRAIFSPDARNTKVMPLEAAIAKAKAKYDVIPDAAAQEISNRADVKYAPLDEVAAEYKRTRHRMVALLNVWRQNLSPEAAHYLHYGVTTVDIYDTVLVMKVRDTVDILLSDMMRIEQKLVEIAQTHRDTMMIGRTLGQHALPLTFGKKVSTWTALNRRNMDRLLEFRQRLNRSIILKGAVGTHLGLGDKAVEVERETGKTTWFRYPPNGILAQ